MPSKPSQAPQAPQMNVERAISAMRDSVWVVNAESQKEPSAQTVGAVKRNVQHLELMVGKEEISNSGQDLSDITAAIAAGNAFVEEHKALLEVEGQGPGRRFLP